MLSETNIKYINALEDIHNILENFTPLEIYGLLETTKSYYFFAVANELKGELKCSENQNKNNQQTQK